MPDLTQPFFKVYDAIRIIKTVDVNDPLKLYDRKGQLIETITSGWYPDEITPEQTGQRILEVYIVDRPGIEFSTVVFLAWGDTRHERNAEPNPPKGNPRKWTFSLKPIGVED